MWADKNGLKRGEKRQNYQGLEEVRHVDEIFWENCRGLWRDTQPSNTLHAGLWGALSFQAHQTVICVYVRPSSSIFWQFFTLILHRLHSWLGYYKFSLLSIFSSSLLREHFMWVRRGEGRKKKHITIWNAALASGLRPILTLCDCILIKRPSPKCRWDDGMESWSDGGGGVGTFRVKNSRKREVCGQESLLKALSCYCNGRLRNAATNSSDQRLKNGGKKKDKKSLGSYRATRKTTLCHQSFMIFW